MQIAITCLLCIVIMTSSSCGGKLKVRSKIAQPDDKDSVENNTSEDNQQTPTLSLTFSINAEATYTSDSAVTLDLDNDTGITEYRKANGSDCSAASWTSYSGSISHTLDAGDGLKTVCLEARNALLHVSETLTDDITLDTTAPISTIAIAANLGPHTTSGANTTITGTASDTTSSVSAVHLAFKNTATSKYLDGANFDSDDPVWYATTGTTSWSYNLSDSLLADGVSYEVSSRASDIVGNIQSTLTTASFTWDATAPSALFSINTGATYTNTPAVTLTLTDATGVHEYRKANGADCSAASWTSYSGPVAHTLQAGDGAKNVCLEVRDTQLNVSGTETDSITLDQTVPGSSFSVANNLGPASTAGPQTSISGTASDATSSVSAVHLAFKNIASSKYLDAGNFDSNEPVWYLATGTTSWSYDLADNLLSHGVTYEISSRATDVAGNVQSSLATDSFTWDSSAPNASFVINNDDTHTGDINVTLTLTDSSDVDQYRVANGADCSSASWTNYTGAISHALTAGDGLKTVCLQVRDSLQNASGTATDSITLDSSLADNGLILIPKSYSGLGYDYYIMAYEASWASGGSAPGGDSVSSTEADLASCNYEFHVNQMASHASCGTKAISKVAQSKINEAPATNVNFAEAFYGCRNASSGTYIMRLPTMEEWSRAAKWIGTSYNSMWTTYSDNTGNNCLVSAGSAANTGARSDCKTTLDIFDMAGNVREWVDSRMVNYDIDGAGESRFSYGPVIGRTLVNGLDNISRRFHTITPGAGGLALTMGADYTTPALADRKQYGPDVCRPGQILQRKAPRSAFAVSRLKPTACQVWRT